MIVRVYDWTAVPLSIVALGGISSDMFMMTIVVVDAGTGWRATAIARETDFQHPDLIRAKERNAWRSMFDNMAGAVN